MISLVRRTSSAPSGSPCAFDVLRLVGAGSAMIGAEGHECRTGGLGTRRLERVGDGAEVVAVADPDDVPAVGLEPPRHVLAEGERRVAVDRDVIVVVDQRQLAEPEVAGDRGGLARDALHEVAVADEGPGAVVDDAVARPIEVLGEESLGDRHADRVADALAQRPGGRLDARRVAPLGMARRLRAPLPERAQLVERQVVPRQVEQGVQQHGGVAAGEDEPVAVGPVGVGGVVPEEPVPQHIGRGRERHRRARVAGLGCLHRVHGQRSDGVDAAPGQRGGGRLGRGRRGRRLRARRGGRVLGERAAGASAVCGQNGSFRARDRRRRRAEAGRGRAEAEVAEDNRPVKTRAPGRSFGPWQSWIPESCRYAVASLRQPIA